MEGRSTTVDVREMLCAQALALVARALARVPRGAVLLVRYNAEDVKRDLAVWGAERGHTVEEAESGVLRIHRTATLAR